MDSWSVSTIEDDVYLEDYFESPPDGGYYSYVWDDFGRYWAFRRLLSDWDDEMVDFFLEVFALPSPL